MLNEVILVGNSTKDIELRESANGKNYCYITVAVTNPPNKNGEKQTDFIDVILWDNSAKFAANYIHKGDGVQLRGRLKIRVEENNGKKRNLIQVVGYEIQNIRSKSGGNASGNPASVANRVEPVEEELVIEGDDLPFY